MRHLATIQKILKIEPIEGADRIELATVLGWHVVIQKGLYQEGDRVIYLEIDSVLPEKLAEKVGFTDKYLKTRRFKGVYSQGMCIPLTELLDTKFSYKEEDIAERAKTGKWDDLDVTEFLGITKWEPDPRNDSQSLKREQNMVKPPKKWYTRFRIGRWFWRKFIYKPSSGPFPTSIVHKTDETRCQILGDILAKYKGTRCQFTEKLDGSSITFWKDKKDKLHVCSRNREIFVKDDFMFSTAERYDKNLKKGFVYQGEILGPNIQGNKYGLKDYDIYVYQVYDTDRKVYLDPLDMERHCTSVMLKTVSVLGNINLDDDKDALVELSEGMSKLPGRGKETQREGIVIRPLENIYIQDSRFVGNRLSFKVINPKFLVKYKI